MAQTEKRENSVLFSLRELRQIEENRVQEEEHAVRSAEEARVAAKQAEERRIREAEEARIRQERDEQLAIETARANAEREARMRVEAHEAAERLKHQAALEQERLVQEMSIRREEARKKRPTWMLAVTGFALVATIIGVYIAIQRTGDADEKTKEAAAADVRATNAEKAAKEATEKVARLEGDLADLNKRMDGAVDALRLARDEDARARADAQLQKLRQEKVDMERRIYEAKQAAAKAERAKGLKISDECKNNPLAKGCM